MAAQEATEVVVDDPTGALGDSRPAVEQAAGGLLEGGVFVVSVVPSLAGQPVEEVIAQRFAQLAPTGSPYNVSLLLVLDQRLAVFGVRDPAAVLTELGEARAAEVLQPLRAGSRAATGSFQAGDAGAAALAGLTEFERNLDGEEGGGGSEVTAEEVVTWVIAAVVLLGLVSLGRDARRWLRHRAVRRSGVGDIRWEEPGRAPSAVPALMAGLSGAVIPVVLPAALAWWLGRTTWREIAASDGQLGGRGFAVAAFVLSGYSLLATVGFLVSGLS